MIRSSGPLDCRSSEERGGRPPGDSCNSAALPTQRAYGGAFWFSYIANLLVLVAGGLLFRYADFVMAIGGTEFHLGWIVGVGMVGSLLVRLAIGQAIDSRGPRIVWLGSLLLFALASFGNLAVTRVDGPAIYALRIAHSCALAGIFGSSLTFIVTRVPPRRMAELWGMLGTAGFLGALIGPLIGDWLLGGESVTRGQIDRMFTLAGLLALGALGFAWLATRDQAGRPRRPRSPLWAVLRQYHPGFTLLWVGVAMGIGLGLPITFIRPFAGSLDIARISVFFTCYSVAAIITRVLTRRLPERLGPRPMILVGLIGLAVSQLLLLTVAREWQMILPGLCYGTSHGLLFPCVVAAANAYFPAEHRGVGNLLILSMSDLGVLIGAPMLGMVLVSARHAGLPAYPTMFVLAATVTAATTVLFWLANWAGVSRKRDQAVDHVAEHCAAATGVGPVTRGVSPEGCPTPPEQAFSGSPASSRS